MTKNFNFSPNSDTDPICPYRNFDSYIDKRRDKCPGEGRPTPQLVMGLWKVNIEQLGSKNVIICLYRTLNLYRSKWEEAVLAARSTSNIASGSDPGAPDGAREILKAFR